MKRKFSVWLMWKESDLIREVRQFDFYEVAVAFISKHWDHYETKDQELTLISNVSGRFMSFVF